jgi:hypothetical protein
MATLQTQISPSSETSASWRASGSLQLPNTGWPVLKIMAEGTDGSW